MKYKIKFAFTHEDKTEYETEDVYKRQTINFRKMFIELEGKLGTVIDVDKKTLKVKIKVDSFSDEEVIALGVVRKADALVAHLAIARFSKNLWFDNFCVEMCIRDRIISKEQRN